MQSSVNEEHVREFDDAAVNGGFYTFFFAENGTAVRIPTPFGFVYEKTPAGWMSVVRHLSKLLEE